MVDPVVNFYAATLGGTATADPPNGPSPRLLHFLWRSILVAALVAISHFDPPFFPVVGLVVDLPIQFFGHRTKIDPAVRRHG
jgi:hypothetical protein